MAFLTFFIFYPILLVGLPTELFNINNFDSQSHEATVEIFDSNNESVFKERYELAPDSGISQPKSSWLLLRCLMPWSKEKALEDEYKFKVILDGEIEETCKMFPYAWTSVEISINKAEGSSPPLFVGVVTV